MLNKLNSTQHITSPFLHFSVSSVTKLGWVLQSQVQIVDSITVTRSQISRRTGGKKSPAVHWGVCVWIFTGAALTSWDIEVILLQHVNRSQNELIGKMLTLFILKQLSAVKELPDVSCNVVKHCQ